MVQVLLDTDVLIEVLRGKEAVTLQWDKRQQGGALFSYSAVTVAELWHGIRHGEETPIRKFLHQMTFLSVDEEVGLLAGQYLQRYNRSHGLDLADALIAATAARHHLSLWTLNRRHFPMPELQLLPA